MTFRYIFSSTNLHSSLIDVIILTNLIFLAFKLKVPTLNIIWSLRISKKCLKSLQSKKIWIVTKENLCRNTSWLVIFESLTDTLNCRTACYYMPNLINNPSSLKLQSYDEYLWGKVPSISGYDDCNSSKI